VLAQVSPDIDAMRLSRRSLLAWLGSGAAGLAFGGPARAQVAAQATTPLPSFTGPGANPYWNGVNPFVSYPQKLPLLRITDRGIQLETPRPYFLTPFTPNAAFYVRYHLDLIPNALDLSTWRLSLEGNVERPLQLGFDELVKNFKAVSVAAVNQCSGNSRSRFQPWGPVGKRGYGERPLDRGAPEGVARLRQDQVRDGSAAVPGS
jgi:DMSO/TMAO reductase YedYZ molybdopterin-dependent catalytic subunit